MMWKSIFPKIVCLAILVGCSEPWNNPYHTSVQDGATLYASFSERPKTLDPARSYSSNEYQFIAQIYEPPLQYHYLKRPYQLEPLTATEVPKAIFYDASDQILDASAPIAQIAYTLYTIQIQTGIHYQPHPAFATDAVDLSTIYALSDFPQHATRELTAADYVYQIKRLAHPKLNSPILSIMDDYIVGLEPFAETLKTKIKQSPVLDLTQYELEGVRVIDRYTYQIKIKGKYPQFLYWLAMPFFAPLPAEADQFYQQPGMKEKNLTLDWYPIGTGPFYLAVHNPNRRMVLRNNPNFHEERYPATSDVGNSTEDILKDAGKRLPFIQEAIYTLEKESIPYWNKFLQGYYDASAIQSDNFDQAIQFDSNGAIGLTQEMSDKGIRLKTEVKTSIYYLGFNMADPIVGGYHEAQKKLRQAISIAINYEEYISIFENGRGIAAQGPIPPGIFGHVEAAAGINPFVYDWVAGEPKRKSIAAAKQLLIDAGYANGIDPETHAPLVLYLDTPGTKPENKAKLAWFRKQLQKLNIQLQIRATDYNRFQEKMRKGNAQLFQWGWNADYPDPENFLFLLFGPNGKMDHQGENAANYNSPAFNQLFERMKNMDNGQERQQIINEMIHILRQDAPWLWGFHPKAFTLHHQWYLNSQPNLMANNTLKYLKIVPKLRREKQAVWNPPKLWPIIIAVVIVISALIPGIVSYRRREQQTAL